MGKFSAREFRWHADAAFYRPDETVIPVPEGDTPPATPKIDTLDCDMNSDFLARTEYFKAALFRLVMERAADFMDTTKQEDQCDERKRYTIVNLQVVMDTSVHPKHDKGFVDEEAPAGLKALKGPEKANIALMNVFVAPEWSDLERSDKAVKIFSYAGLDCHPRTE